MTPFFRFRPVALPVLLLTLAVSACAQIKLDLKNGVEEWYLPTADTHARLYVREMGKGPTIIVVHGGFGAEHGYLVEPLKFLAKDHRLVFYDQRGSLRSPCAAEHISIDKHVEDLELLRAKLGLEKITLFGHSMGAYLSSAYLEKYPQHMKGMVLVGLPYARTPVSDEDRKMTQESDKRFMAFVGRPEVAAELKKYHLDGTAISAREDTRKWRITFAAGNVYNVGRWQQLQGGQVFYSQDAGSAAAKSMKKVDFIQTYARQKFPISVINGSHDLVDMGGDVYRTLLRAAPNVQYTLLPKAGHNSWIDQEALFQAAVLRTVKVIDSTRD